MLQTLQTILRANWEWRGQIGRLAIFDLMKRSRGAVFSYAWLFVRPAIFIFVFWFALEIGLRAGGDAEWPPYIIWLAAGLMPWFFMVDMMGPGANVLRRYSYLVNKIKFPLSAISAIYTCSSMLVELGLIVGLFGMYFFAGLPLDIYFLQVPIILLFMFVFWDCFSIWTSQLSALSKDFANLVKAMIQPFFWLSGIIYNTATLPLDWIQTVLLFDPVTFFVTAMRNAFYDKMWFWENPEMCWAFAFMFIAQLVLMLAVYKKTNEDVADVL